MTTTLVTGATRGVGLELSRRLAEVGHIVYVGARDLERGRDVAETIGGRALLIDVTDDGSVQRAVDQLAQEVGMIDVLVNNAGIAGAQRPPAEADVEDLQKVLETNVVGATRVLVACTRLLEESAAPVVVNVSSAVGSLTLNAGPDAVWSMVAYPMSKAALNMLTVQYARAFPRWRVKLGHARPHAHRVHRPSHRLRGPGDVPSCWRQNGGRGGGDSGGDGYPRLRWADWDVRWKRRTAALVTVERIPVSPCPDSARGPR